MNLNFSAVVVLFNPDESVVKKITSYSNQVDKVYAIDNSDIKNEKVINKIISIENLTYISNGENIGIAAALNIGAQKAIEDHYEYLLTMDQDSSAPEGMVSVLYEIVKPENKIAIAAAEHFNSQIHNIKSERRTTEVKYTMTSGNLLRLSAYQQAGGFLEKLFIDYVDHEYCLRLKTIGYKIIKTSKTYVYHSLGNSEKKKFLLWNIYPTHHLPERLYYRTRNRYYVNKTYKEYFPDYVNEDYKNQFREFLFLLFGEKNLFVKLSMIIKGFIDYKKNVYGKYKPR